jgi:DHA1 family multidrug resistance protein-like MFS transporter
VASRRPSPGISWLRTVIRRDWGAALAPSLLLVFVAQFCIGLAQGVSYPTLMGMSIQYVADAERTPVMGLHQAVYAIGMFGEPWLSGRLADAVGIQPMFGVAAFVCLILGLFVTRQLAAEGADQAV